MKKLKIGFGAVAGAMVLFVALNVVNVLQNGLGGPDGRSPDQILGVRAEDATRADLAKLSKADLMQLFFVLPSPRIDELKGEFPAENLKVGVMAFSVGLYTDYLFGPGRWKGKGFLPGKGDRGQGYNLFLDPAKKKLSRTRRMETFVGPSNIDDKRSFHLVYARFNRGLVDSMHDELREVNGRLLLGMGYMALGGGSINPSPFVVHGTPAPWRGPDPEI